MSSLSNRRSSGLLLHPTSLPGAHGSGDLGDEALGFADFLAAAAQRWWQMLPVGPPGALPGYSPYSSFSAFAGSPWLIALAPLERDGLLSMRDLRAPAAVRRGDLASAQRFRRQRLHIAWTNFQRLRPWERQFDDFCRAQADWLDDFALFHAIRQASGHRWWLDWPAPLRLRRRRALVAARADLRDAIRFHQFVQFLFDRQWSALRAYCRERGIGLIGDIPIFVALDSADVWSNPRLFLLDRAGRPKVVSGCPPDDFCADGQLWGHPHYDWTAHRRSGFKWWVRRFEMMLHRFDAVRVDHFLGFNRAWAVPARSRTAKRGSWLDGPGDDLFRAVRGAVGNLPVIAEDLGAVVPAAIRLRDRWRLPGMRVMQFGFSPGGSDHLPHRYPRRCVAYTGTHDNQTIMGWLHHPPGSDALARRQRDKALHYLNCSNPRQFHWDAIRAVMFSHADTVILPVQDVLGLGDEARMNVPGVADHQWRWRLRDQQHNSALAARLRGMTLLCERDG